MVEDECSGFPIAISFGGVKVINNIDDLIHHLESVKRSSGQNMFVRTQIQIGLIIEVDTKIERFYNEDKSVSIDVLIIVGYKTK